MDALDVMRVCVKRWWVMLPILLMAGVAGLGLSNQLKPEYTAYGSYALVYSHADQVKVNQLDPRNANPLSTEGGVVLGEAIMADLLSPPSQNSMGRSNRGFGPGQTDNNTAFAVSTPQGARSFLVQTWGDTMSSVRDTVEAVLQAAPERAKEIQDRAGAPAISQYTTFTTTPTQVVELPPQSRMKIILTVFGIGLVAGAALSLLVDRVVVRRQRSKRKQARRAAREWAGLADSEPDESTPEPSEPPASVGPPSHPTPNATPPGAGVNHPAASVSALSAVVDQPYGYPSWPARLPTSEPDDGARSAAAGEHRVEARDSDAVVR